MNTEVIVTGRVLKLRKLGSKLAFAILYTNNQELPIVFFSDCLAKPGDLILISGRQQMTNGRAEIHVADCTIIKRPRNRQSSFSQISRTMVPQQLNKLALRAQVVQLLHHFFYGNSFLPVCSPAIVGSWVKGQTGHFSLDFYDDKAYLSISNMLYHHVYACNGFTAFYELGKIFRQEKPSMRKRLAEFTMLDVSQTNINCRQMMDFFEQMIRNIVAGAAKTPVAGRA